MLTGRTAQNLSPEERIEWVVEDKGRGGQSEGVEWEDETRLDRAGDNAHADNDAA